MINFKSLCCIHVIWEVGNVHSYEPVFIMIIGWNFPWQKVVNSIFEISMLTFLYFHCYPFLKFFSISTKIVGFKWIYMTPKNIKKHLLWSSFSQNIVIGYACAKAKYLKAWCSTDNESHFHWYKKWIPHFPFIMKTLFLYP